MKEYSAKSVYKKMRTSPRKLLLVANLIKGMPVFDAIQQLSFLKRRIAGQVKKCLVSAVANAEHNHGLNVDRLIIGEISVGKALVMKRMMPRARGKGARIKKFFSNLYITVKEQ